jgi:hypothetical protein
MSSKTVLKRQSNKEYETNHSAYGSVGIRNRKQGHYSDRRICEMIMLNEIRYNPAKSAFVSSWSRFEKFTLEQALAYRISLEIIAKLKSYNLCHII